jgi:hypothetical protein
MNYQSGPSTNPSFGQIAAYHVELLTSGDTVRTLPSHIETWQPAMVNPCTLYGLQAAIDGFTWGGEAVVPGTSSWGQKTTWSAILEDRWDGRPRVIHHCRKFRTFRRT